MTGTSSPELNVRELPGRTNPPMTGPPNPPSVGTRADRGRHSRAAWTVLGIGLLAALAVLGTVAGYHGTVAGSISPSHSVQGSADPRHDGAGSGNGSADDGGNGSSDDGMNGSFGDGGSSDSGNSTDSNGSSSDGSEDGAGENGSFTGNETEDSAGSNDGQLAGNGSDASMGNSSDGTGSANSGDGRDSGSNGTSGDSADEQGGSSGSSGTIAGVDGLAASSAAVAHTALPGFAPAGRSTGLYAGTLVVVAGALAVAALLTRAVTSRSRRRVSPPASPPTRTANADPPRAAGGDR